MVAATRSRWDSSVRCRSPGEQHEDAVLGPGAASATMKTMSDLHDVVPVAPPDLDAATTMWADYAATRPRGSDDRDDTVEHFGDTARLAEELLQIVLSGGKRATAELVSEFAHEVTRCPGSGRTGSRATARAHLGSSSGAPRCGSARSAVPMRRSPSRRARTIVPSRAGNASTGATGSAPALLGVRSGRSATRSCSSTSPWSGHPSTPTECGGARRSGFPPAVGGPARSRGRLRPPKLGTAHHTPGPHEEVSCPAPLP